MSIEIYIGPMFAGKTTKLISMYNENKDSNKVVIDYNKELSINNLINHTTIKLEKAYKGPYLSIIQE